ncbi:uncharacterized protein N7458_011684 [Penicillium daleae]|uniref:Uncharacterized protein n=1 Tax=Penicillium daleae TaxID=63821 RepID=A0AAD6BUF9_9EURO|nr:uncharacterized protein N7458_011684 [Penicillium daleae]KAJ5432528.1 hypothetical protein N7458_011684 [Penicillium daleae]
MLRSRLVKRVMLERSDASRVRVIINAHTASEKDSAVCQGSDQSAVRKYTPESPSEQARPKYNLPLPQGIDHEVPRWSAMYSMFTEALRLIPPEGFQMNDTRKRAVSMEREQSPDRKKSCSVSNNSSDPDARASKVKRESIITTIESAISSYDTLSSIKPTTPQDEIKSIAPRNAGAGIFFGELDALLRF